jgi:uncharacterized protein YfaS (alpha-2-macroglobulin family)
MPPAIVEKEVIVNPGQTAAVEVRVRPMGAILGTVENTSTNALLKGVRVQLVDSRNAVVRETSTGDDGAYRFSGLPAGDHRVRILLPRGYLADGETEQAVTIQGASEARADFFVYRHGAIEGRVVMDDGTPLASVDVTLIDSTGAVVRTAKSDAQGGYSFQDVPVDKYTVRVTVPDSPTA